MHTHDDGTTHDHLHTHVHSHGAGLADVPHEHDPFMPGGAHHHDHPKDGPPAHSEGDNSTYRNYPRGTGF